MVVHVIKSEDCKDTAPHNGTKRRKRRESRLENCHVGRSFERTEPSRGDAWTLAATEMPYSPAHGLTERSKFKQTIVLIHYLVKQCQLSDALHW